MFAVLEWLNEFMVDVVVLAGLAVVATVPRLPVHQRLFRLDDLDISYPYTATEIISNKLLLLVTAAAPALLILTLCMVRAWNSKRTKSVWLFTRFLLGFLLAHLLTHVLTDVMKTQVGRLRPDFLARCLPVVTPSTVGEKHGAFVFYDGGVCTGDSAVIQSGRVSFPSGHASTAFVGLSFLSLTLFTLLSPTFVPIYRKLPTTSHTATATAADMNVGVLSGNVVRFVVSGVPLVVASYIAITRLQQTVHNPTDVIVGGMVGVAIALVVWWFYLGRDFSTSPPQHDPFPAIHTRFDTLTTAVYSLRSQVQVDEKEVLVVVTE